MRTVGRLSLGAGACWGLAEPLTVPSAGRAPPPLAGGEPVLRCALRGLQEDVRLLRRACGRALRVVRLAGGALRVGGVLRGGGGCAGGALRGGGPGGWGFWGVEWDCGVPEGRSWGGCSGEVGLCGMGVGVLGGGAGWMFYPVGKQDGGPGSRCGASFRPHPSASHSVEAGGGPRCTELGTLLL